MSDVPTPPGWYPDVERAGGERWWDGRAWTEFRRPAGSPSSDPMPGGGPPAQPVWGSGPPAPQGYVPFGATTTAYPESSKAGWALGLSIFGLFCCAITSIVGLVLGRSELTAIDEGRVDPRHRGTAQAAFVVGIVAVSLAAVFIVIGLIGGLVET